MLTLSTASAQTMPPVQNAVYVYPVNPTPTDSVSVIFTYVSGDSCPDFLLVTDSVVANRIYVSKQSIVNPRVICAQIVTKFTTTLKLGILPENTQIYFEGVLINTIQFPCVMDKSGVVVNCGGQLYIEETTIYLSAIARLYVIQNMNVPNSNGTTQNALKEGDKVNFGGYLTPNITSLTDLCHTIGIATCYEVVLPPAGCVKDKKGMVVNCGGQLFIQEYSPISSSRQLYSINSKDSIDSNGHLLTGLKEGDHVIFGGYPVKLDSLTKNICSIVGIATCYEVISTPPPCVMDKTGIVTQSESNSSLLKETLTGDIYVISNVTLAPGTQLKFKGTKIECFTTPCYNLVDCYQVISTPTCVMDKTGVIVAGIDGCTGSLFIQDTSTPNTSIQLYAIGNSIVGNDTVQKGLKVGDKVKFGGYLIKNDSSIIKLCNVAGIATCYEVVVAPPVCVMDKPGVVVTGIEGCIGQLFIEETTPYMSAIRRLYSITNPSGLKVGDQVKFGGYLIKNSSMIKLCNIAGIATCYEVVVTPPVCVMDKPGVVVTGVEGCIGQLFIEETTPYMSAIRRLYSITNPSGLKVGDQVKFGGYLTVNDSVKTTTCHTIGVATCYMLISSEKTYTLSGTAVAGNEIMKSGLAILYKRGELKATGSYSITDGTFSFTNLPTAEYTVYVIPDLSLYKNYLPTYYINKFLYNEADYVTLTGTMTLMVNLKPFVFPTGNGKISGNIFFESYNLKDSALVNTGQVKTNNVAINNSAINIPVILLNSAGIPVAWTMTDVYGNYTFENIALDTYRIVAQTASAIGESLVNLTPANSTINADLALKSSQNNTALPNVDDSLLGLYPNPMTDNLIITMKASGKVDIYNSMGQLLIHQILNPGINIVEGSALKKGVYVAKIGQTTMKIIKK